MRIVTTPPLGGVMITVLAALAAAPAAADDVHCPPDLGAVEIDGNVLVAAPCRLDGTTVKGNVEVFAGGSLVAVGATIIGNVQAAAADAVDLDDTAVNGSVQLDDMVGAENLVTNSEIGGSIQQVSSLNRLIVVGSSVGADIQVLSNDAEVVVDDSDVTGNVQLEGVGGASSAVANSRIVGGVQLVENTSMLDIAANSVGADLQAFSNTGGVTVERNVIDGNLQCKSNEPAPAGSDNQVSGNAEDQCAGLQSAVVASGGNNVALPSLGSDTARSSGGSGSLGPAAAVLLLIAGVLGVRRRGSGATAV